MSKYLNLTELPIRDRELLIEVLGEMRWRGVQEGLSVEIESHETPQQLYGFGGDLRPERAEIIIRRNYVGGASNDLGFMLTESGNFKPIISGFDRGFYNNNWLESLTQKYGVKAYTKTMNEGGMELTRTETLPTGEISMTFVPYGGM